MTESFAQLALQLLTRVGALELSRVISLLESQGRKIDHMTTTLAQLDAAIAADQQVDATLLSAVSALATISTQIKTDVTRLLAKVQAGQPVDLSAELVAIQAATTKNADTAASIQQVVSDLTASDASVNPPPPPPPPPVTP